MQFVPRALRSFIAAVRLVWFLWPETVQDQFPLSLEFVSHSLIQQRSSNGFEGVQIGAPHPLHLRTHDVALTKSASYITFIVELDIYSNFKSRFESDSQVLE